ncbi:hypothetical protein F5Y09DRAFT_357722 [Xylaria sp. FL1042]|nr:hypothetical protein F5Y09DRAFT_357722 [Xylaria sp. FL1042]
MAYLILFLTAWCFCIRTSATLLVERDRRNNDRDQSVFETFVNPPAIYRPKYRYWLPDASVPPGNVAADIAQLGQRGAGGVVRVFGIQSEVRSLGLAATDWNIYGFGTAAYLDILQTALQAHKDNDLIMDYTLGLQSGQGVPAEADNPGLTWDVLLFYNASIANGTYSGLLPGWGVGDLVSAVTFAVYDATNHSDYFGGIFGMPLLYNYTQYIMSAESLTDITDLVEEDGSITATVTQLEDEQVQFLIYASYARHSYERACIASTEIPQDLLQNGSFAYIMVDSIKGLLIDVGGAIFEDSVEIPANTYWTPDLPYIFQRQHGYSMVKYLPLLSGNEGDLAQGGGPIQFISDSEDHGTQFVTDYRFTMSSLITEYVSSMQYWTNCLGLQYRHQVGYNLPVDMPQPIPEVDIPETETLAFDNNIDRFRQFCGAANLAAKPIISIELGGGEGGDYWRSYAQSWADLLKDAKRAYVAGVNQVVIHRAPYSYGFGNTTWPGYTTFQYLFGGQHSRHQPAWDVGYEQANKYLARIQVVLQTGVPRVDIAFWDKMTAQSAYPYTLYTPDDLAKLGYTYNHLSPENFALDDAYVAHGVLPPNRQRFKALIVWENDTLTTQGVEDLETYAEAGLQLIIPGAIPSTYTTNNETRLTEARSTWQRITALGNVYQVANGPPRKVLGDIGIKPRAQIASDGARYTVWRDDYESYIFIYNDGDYSTGTITFETTKAPYLLNCWTGERTPILQYVVDNSSGTTEIPFVLEKAETTVVLFSNLVSDTRPEHVPSLSPLLGLYYEESSRSVLMKTRDSDTTPPVALSTKWNLSTPNASVSPFNVTDWRVTVEQWLPPIDLFDVESQKINVTADVPGPTLSSWAELNLASASGVGYYVAEFSWETSDDQTGAILAIPPLVHGVTASINGRSLPALDIANPKADVTDYLTDGTNTILIKVSTTLVNSVALVWDDLMTLGVFPPIPFDVIRAAGFGESVNGIIGQVQIQPYQLIKVYASMP